MTIIENWTCQQDQYSVAPYTFSLDELVDLKIDEEKQMEKGCGPINAVTHNSSLKDQGFGWPDNGEFDWGSWGDTCWMASDKHGCEYLKFGYVLGKRGKVKRVAYKGDPLECCKANTSAAGASKTADGKTCDPDKYRNASSYECNALLDTYCKENDNMNTQECKNLVKSNSTLYNQLMSDYCNRSKDNAQKDVCSNWCSTNSSKCTLINLINSCKEKGLDESCTQTDIDNLQSECVKYGMVTGLGTVIGDYKCTKEGLATLKADCDTYKLDSGSCSANALDTAKRNAFESRENQLTRDQAAEEYQKTQDAIKQITGIDVSLDTTTTMTPSTTSSTSLLSTLTSGDNLYITIGIILVVVLIFSSSLSLLFVM